MEEALPVITPVTKRLAALTIVAAVAATACSGGATQSPSGAAPSVATPSQPSGSSASPAGAAAPAPSSASMTLQGAGATFPAPLYQTWFEAFNGKYSNIQIDYQANGSGAGIKAITEGTV